MAIWFGVLALTVFNAGLLWAIWQRVEINTRWWRISLATAPTPMLGIAGSYGVYAYNTLFMPWYWACIMAAAYEVTYIGLAALDGLTPDQRTRATQVAMHAAWISFAQNALAGLFYAMPVIITEVRGLSIWWQLPFWVPLALLHGALVYVGFTTANLTLHRPDAQEAPATGRTMALAKLAQPEPPRLAEQPDYPAPVPMRRTYAPRPARATAVKLPPLPAPAADASRDELRAWVVEMVDRRGYKQAEIARLMERSRAWIGQLYHAGRKNGGAE